jgi:hypothetical protein
VHRRTGGNGERHGEDELVRESATQGTRVAASSRANADISAPASISMSTEALHLSLLEEVWETVSTAIQTQHRCPAASPFAETRTTYSTMSSVARWGSETSRYA